MRATEIDCKSIQIVHCEVPKKLNNYNTGRRKGNLCYNFILQKVEFGEQSELGG